MNLLTRKLINPNIVIYDTETNFHPVTATTDTGHRVVKTTTYTELCTMIDQWKIFLLEKYNAQPGETVFIQGHPNADYYSLIFATWELGLINILDLPRCFTKDDVISTKTKIFGTIDYIIRTASEKDIYGAQLTGEAPRWFSTPVFVHELARDRRQGRNILGINDCLAYQVQDPEKYKDVADMVFCTPASNLIKYPSSGTTGDPKLVYMSHNNTVTMAKRYIEHTDCKSTDRALHTNNLNHGSTLMIHWLPSFMVCDVHYTANASNIADLAQFADQVQINRTLLFTTNLLTEWLNSITPVSRPLKIMTLFQITNEIIALAQEKNVTIYGMFGASDIGGFFFLKVIDSKFDPVDYTVSWMGKPADDFWLFDIRDEVLWIACPALNIDWCTANDKFKVVDNDYYFLGRADRYRIGETWFGLAEIEKLVSNQFGDNANIIVDTDQQKLYLAIWNANTVAEQHTIGMFKTAYPNLTIDYIMRGQSKDQFSSGRKVDNSKIRDYCRNQLNNAKS